MKRNAVQVPGGLPIIPDINEEIFDRAGISKQDRADLLAKVFAKTVKRMSATHVKVFAHEGELTYSKPLVDHTTQGKAVEQALQLVGLQKQEAPKIVVKAVVTLPSYAVPRGKVVESLPLTAIESPKVK